MAHETDTSMGTLVRGALEDVRELFREEVALARAELREEVSRATVAATGFGAAAAAGWFAGMLLLSAVALAIGEELQWPLWSGFAIVGALLAMTAGVLLFAARRAMRTVRGLPHTVHTVKETVEELK